MAKKEEASEGKERKKEKALLHHHLPIERPSKSPSPDLPQNRPFDRAGRNTSNLLHP
jgi:hypothetical protein